MKKRTITSSFGSNGRVSHSSEKFYNSRLYREINDNAGIKNEIENPFPAEYENCIINASSEKMNQLPGNCVQLMITSPPYNVSKEYDADLSLKEYLELLDNVFRETYRVLVDGGRACINVANVGRKPYVPLSDHISSVMMNIGFSMRGEIIWDKGAAAGVSTAWGSWQSASNPTLRDTHEYILVFTKGMYKREKEQKKNTIAKEQFMDWTKSIWRMNPESARKIGHPALFPEELPFRLIQLYSFEGDVILDPFIGSGTTAVAALKSSRKYVGFETSETYANLAKQRIASCSPVS